LEIDRGFSEKKENEKQKQKITKMTTIAVIAFSVLAMGILGGSAYGQPSPPACPNGFNLERGECVQQQKGICPSGFAIDPETLRCTGKPGRPAGTAN
jgi:hypothetical protein